MHVPFPLQCWHVIAKLSGYNNSTTRKGRRGKKGGKIFQSVSRFLSEIVVLPPMSQAIHVTCSTHPLFNSTYIQGKHHRLFRNFS